MPCARAISNRPHRDSTKRKGPQPYDKGSLAGFPGPGPKNSTSTEETAHPRYVIGYLRCTGPIHTKWLPKKSQNYPKHLLGAAKRPPKGILQSLAFQAAVLYILGWAKQKWSGKSQCKSDNRAKSRDTAPVPKAKLWYHWYVIVVPHGRHDKLR